MFVIWRFPVWLRWVAGLALLVPAVCLFAWSVRIPVVSQLVHVWCLQHNLTCRFEFTHLDFDKVVLAAIDVDGPGVDGLFLAEQVTLRLDWPRFMRPDMRSVALHTPHVRVAHDGRKVTFAGLEALFTTDDNDPDRLRPVAFGPIVRAVVTALPGLEIRDGTVDITTPAGTLTGRFAATGEMARKGTFDVVLQPAELSFAGQTLSVESGEITIRTATSRMDGRANLHVDGRASLHVSRAQLGELAVTNFHVGAELWQTGPDLIPKLNWRAEGEYLNWFDRLTLSGFEAGGEVLFAAAGQKDRHHVLSKLVAHGQTRKAGGIFASADAVRFELEARTAPDGTVHAGFGAVVDTLSLSYGVAHHASIGWTGSLQPKTHRLQGGGQFVLQQMRIASSWQKRLTDIPGATGHVRAIRTALKRGMQNFSTDVRYQTDIRSAADWRIVVPETIALTTPSGQALVLALTKPADGAVVIAPDRVMASGFLELTGRNLPVLKADLQAFVMEPDRLVLRTGGISLTPWQVGNTSLAADLNRLYLVHSQTATRAELVGELSVSASGKGMKLARARLFGGVSAAYGPEGWRVQALEQDGCLGLDIHGLGVGSNLSFGDLVLPLCPQGGRFVHYRKGYASGILNLGNIVIPSTLDTLEGVARLTDARLSWSAGKMPTLAFTAEAFSLPIVAGQHDVTLHARAPQIALTFDGQPHIEARFVETVLSGSVIPTGISVREINLDGILTPSGLTGQGNATGVLVDDPGSDPLHHALMGDFKAFLDGARINLSGAMYLAGNPETAIADIGGSIDLARHDGQVSVQSRELVFAKGGLQPRHLSDRLRGLFSNSRGTLHGKADFRFTPDGLSGSGTVTAAQFGFDTQGLGAIDGVSGTIRFSDILSLTTDPGQEITIAALNPGIALMDGRLTFQVRDGSVIHIGRAVWPFAGGTLEVEPVHWRLSDKNMRLVVDVRDIELPGLVAALSLPDIQANGLVSGRLPLRLQDGNVFLDKARLAAGSGGGILQYTGNAVNTLSETGIAATAFTALQDFHFSVLEIAIDGNLIGDIVVHLVLLGHNPDVWEGAPFRFKIGIDSNLAELVRIGQTGSNTDMLIEMATQNR